MKCTLHKSNIVEASKKAMLFIPDKPVIPAYECYLLSFSKNSLAITASNGENQITVSCDINCQDEEVICVDAAKFHKIIDAINEVDISLKIKGTGANGAMRHLVIVGNKLEHKLPILLAEHYPVIDHPEAKHVIKMDAKALVEMWESVSVLVNGKDEVRRQLSGLNHTVNDAIPDSIIISGGTVFRMAMASVRAEVRRWKSVIIHRDVCYRSKEVFAKTGSLTIIHDGVRAMVTDGTSPGSGTVHVISRLLDEKFPDIVKLVTTAHSFCNHNVSFSWGEAMDSVKRLNFHKTETIFILRADIGDKDMTFNFTNNDTSTSGDEGITISGNPFPMTLGMDINKLNDCLKCLNCQSVDFRYTAPNKAYILQPVDAVSREWNLTVLLAPSSL